MMLNHDEWKEINALVEQLWIPDNEKVLRKKILKNIKDIIPYTLGGFGYYSHLGNYKEPKIEDYIMLGDCSREFMKEHAYLYDNVYGKHDYTKWLLGSKESVVCRESDIISKTVRDRTTFYNDFLKPRNLLYCMDCYIVKDSSKPMILFFYRDNILGDFSDRDVYIMNVLLPHIEGRFFLNSHQDLAQSIDDLFSVYLKNNYGFTWRETEVAKLVREGKSNKEISDILSIKIPTVKKHITSLLGKTNVDTRIKLIKLLDELLSMI